MREVTIIGCGLGPDSLTTEAKAAISQADLLLGAPRLLELLAGQGQAAYPCYLPQDLAAVLAAERAVRPAILVSGDVGFYSAATALAGELAGYQLKFIPGISSLAAFFARLHRPWQEVALVSAHGRQVNIVDSVRRNRQVFCLTGNNVSQLADSLVQAGFADLQVFVGENLGAETERVYESRVRDLTAASCPALTVLLLINEGFFAGCPTGLRDESFTRLASVPMTKAETRALIMSKLRLKPDDTVWDIGAGTGSVTVEMALSVYQGQVYALERREEALPVIKENLQRFQLGNVRVLAAEAPAGLADLPAPDAVFIGGSGGKIQAIIDLVLEKNPRARLVVTAVSLETVSQALQAFQDRGLEPDIVQQSVARVRPAGKSHLLQAENPIYIFSAGGDS